MNTKTTENKHVTKYNNQVYMQNGRNVHRSVTLMLFIINNLSIKKKKKTGKCTV